MLAVDTEFQLESVKGRDNGMDGRIILKLKN
jgi:hypothetical protein